MFEFTPHAWFWRVGENEGRWWSSEAGGYVTKLPDDAPVSPILNEQELTDVLAAYGLPGPIAPVLTNLSKNVMWKRMSDEEAVAADALLRAQPPRIYRQYEGATHISTDAELYPLLVGGMTQLFGAKRAALILEPDF